MKKKNRNDEEELLLWIWTFIFVDVLLLRNIGKYGLYLWVCYWNLEFVFEFGLDMCSISFNRFIDWGLELGFQVPWFYPDQTRNRVHIRVRYKNTREVRPLTRTRPQSLLSLFSTPVEFKATNYSIGIIISYKFKGWIQTLSAQSTLPHLLNLRLE